EAGRTAVLGDPSGARFAVHQPGDCGAPDIATGPGMLCWAELYTTDAAAAGAFYRAVLSWETDRHLTIGAHVFSLVRPRGAGPADAHCAAVVQLLPGAVEAGARSEWHPYIAVLDCDATAAAVAAHGAGVVVPPADVPGVGRVALFTDPFGATFGVIAAGAAPDGTDDSQRA
ncbi:VOC family protein, partial [Streptomyces sp. NPDC049577]|uniref:VOC family protein n=1 Tax=Streptomyces sp. NPDC049577 TaxID=3155153 RepID=UPI00342B1FF5